MKRLARVLLFAACGGGESAAPAQEPAPPAPAATSCVPGGCSGSVCADASKEQMMTTCEMKPEYACYHDAECKVQDDGACGWTMDDKLKGCLASPPPLQ